MRAAWVLLLLSTTSACAGQPGACVENARQIGSNIVRQWCAEVKTADQCPLHQETEHFFWEWHPDKRCGKLGFPFDCGDGTFEDIDTECAVPPAS